MAVVGRVGNARLAITVSGRTLVPFFLRERRERASADAGARRP